MPKYVTSLTDGDDQKAEQDGGALVDFSKFDPEFSEVTAPVGALRSDGTLRQWFFTAPDSPYVKKMGGPVFGARAPNVKPAEPQQNPAEVSLDPEVERRRALRQGAVAQKARRNLMGATSVAADEQMARAGILPTTEEGQRSLATALKAQKDATLPSPERGFWENLSTAIGGRANEGLIRDIETARDADVSPSGLARGAKAALGTFSQDKSGAVGERIARSIANATPMGALVEAGKAFAGETMPKAVAAYRWAETLGTPRIGELANATSDYVVERSREETGERRQAENKKLAEEIARQRRETPAGEEMPYKLPEFQAETARSAAGMEKTGRLAEHIYQGAKTVAGGLGSAVETLLTPTNVVLMNAPGAVVRTATGAAGKDGAVSAITGLGERSVVQRLREGAARAGAKSTAAANEANTLREVATEAALKNAGAATPEQATGLIARTRAALRGEGDGILTAPLENNLWWTKPGRTATVQRIKADLLSATAKGLSNERAMHTGVGAYFGYEMAKNLPQNLVAFGEAADRSYKTGNWSHIQGAMPALTEAAMLFTLGAHQFNQAKGAHFRTQKGRARYRAEQAQREALKQYDLGDTAIQRDFTREAFTGKDVRPLRDEKGDVIPDHWAVRMDPKAPVATVVKFVREGEAQFDPATGQTMEQAAWFDPPAKGVPPTINLRIGMADRAHGVHEVSHLLTETGQLSGSLRDIEKELGLEYGAIQDVAGITKLRYDLASKVGVATPEGQVKLREQIARLDKAAKGIERLPELVERTVGSSETFIDSMNRLAEIKQERPDILDVFERAQKDGDREALSQIYADPELRQIYTDTVILGSPEAVAQARKNQVTETLRFLITGKKSAADVARDIREGRFSLGDAKPPAPNWKPSEIAAGEKGKELPPPEMPVDAIGLVRKAKAEVDAAKADLAKLKATPDVTPEQRIAAAEKVDAADRAFRSAQTSGIAALKEAEKAHAAWVKEQSKRIDALDLTTEAGRERRAILMEEALKKDEEISTLREVMKGVKEPPPPPPPVRLAEAPPPMPGPVTPLTETVKRIVDASVTGRPPDFSDIARPATFEPGFPIRDRAERRAQVETKYGGMLAGLESGDPGAEVVRRVQERRPAQIKAGIARGIAEAARAQARRAEMVRDIPSGIYGETPPAESFAERMQPPTRQGRERAGGPAELGKSPARFSMRTALRHLDRDMGWVDQWLALAHPRISTEGVITTGAAAAERLGVRHGIPVEGLNPTTKTKWVQTGKEKNTGTLVVAHEDGTPALIYSLENGRVLGAWNPKLEVIDETKPPVEKQGEDAVASVWRLTDPDSPQRRAHAALAEVGVKRNLPFGTFTYYGRRNLDLFTPDQESMRLFRSWARRPKDLVGKIFYQEGDSRSKTPLTLAQIKKGFLDLFNPDQSKRNAFTPESFAIHMAEMDRVRQQYYSDTTGKSALRYAGEDFTPPLEVRHGGVEPGSPGDVGGATGSDRPGAAPAGEGLDGRVLRAEGAGDVAPDLGDQPGSPTLGRRDAAESRFSSRLVGGKDAVFYSKLRRAVEKGQERWRPADLKNYLKSKGVKPEEIEWSKLDDLLKSKPVVTKQGILDHLDTNAVKVEEVVLGEPYAVEWKDEGGRLKLREEKKGTLFGIVETLPDGRAEANIGGGKKDIFDSLDEAKSFVEEVYAERRDNKSPTRFGDYTLPGGREYRELLFKLPGNEYEGGHYEKGTFAHARFNERTGPNGERILHIEEIQSDQHQKAREARVDEIERIAEEQGIAEDEAAKLVPEDFGYTKPVQFPSYEGWLSENVLPEAQSDPAFRRVYEGDRARAQEKADRDRIPNAPFKRTWSELVLKRLFRWAADNGYDRVTWTTGEQQADRYDLAKQIDRVEYDVANHELLAYGHNGREVLREEAEPTVNSLAKHIGKDPAARLVEKIREQDSSSSRDDWSIVRSDEGAWFEVFDPNGEPYYDLKGDILKFWSRQAAERAIDSMLDQDRATTPKPFISGLDLKIGGEGMSGFYDKMLPNKVADIARKLDPSMKVGTTTIDVDGTPTEVHSIDLTPKAREAAKQGFPLFSSRQTQTPEFKKWFGESKVVDKDGKPLVVYHGTDAEFTRFDTNAGINMPVRHAAYFSDSPDVASDVASLRGNKGGARALPVYLKIANPLIVDAHGKHAREMTAEVAGKLDDHDGVVIQNVREFGRDDLTTTYAVFDPTQIKSATGNRGTFDPTNPDIRYSTRGIRPSNKDPRRTLESFGSFEDVRPTKVEKSIRRQIDALERRLDAAYKAGADQDSIDRMEMQLARLTEREYDREGDYLQDREPPLEEGVGIEESLAKEYAGYRRTNDPEERANAVARMRDTLTATEMGWSGVDMGTRPNVDALPEAQVLDAARDAYEARLKTRQNLATPSRFSSRPAPVLSHAGQQTLKELNDRFGIPTPRKETDLGWLTEFTRTFADEREGMNKLERILDWRSHPDYKDEYSSPFLAAQDMGAKGTTELAIFGVRATRGKAALPSGQIVDVGPMILDRSGPKPVYKFHTHKNAAGETVYTRPVAATLHEVGNLRLPAFRAYLAALHALDVIKTDAPKHGLGDEAKHQALIDEIERNPATNDFKDLAEDFTAFQHWMLDYAVSKRAMSRELADYLKEKYPHFMPMERLFEQETGAGNVGSGGASTGTPVKTRKGSDRKVVDPVWQTIARTHRWVSQVDKTAVGAAVTEMMDGILGDKTTAGKLAGILEYDQRKARAPLAGGMSEEAAIVQRNAAKAGVQLTPDQAEAMAAIATPRHDFDKSTRAFEVVVDGKVRRIQADESVIRFMKAVNATPAPMPKWAQALLSIVTIPTSILKGVVTSLPAFQASQLLRDPATATLQTTSPKAGLANRLLLQPVKGRVMPLLEIARDAGRTVGNAIGKVPSIDEALFQAAYQRGPGMFSNLSAHDLDSQSKMYDRLQQEIAHGKGWGDFLYYKGHPLQFLELLKAPFESATRKAEMRRYRKAGMGDVAGTIAGKHISVDFSPFGAAPFMHEANRIFPFLNAGIQSTRKFFQTMRGYDPISGKYDPKRAAEVWARAAIWQTLPTIILWSLNKGDDEIENLRKGDTGLYYNFLRLPKEAGGKAGRIVAMPKAFTWSTVFSTIPEAMLDAIHEANPEALKGTIDGVRAAFDWEPYQPDAKAEVDRRPLGRVVKGIGKEISAGSMPPAVNIYSGIKNNVDPFYSRKIEMEHQRGMEAPQRQGYRTGAMSKDLSQAQFDALRAVSQNPLAKALDIDLSKSALGPDQIAFVASQLGLRDPYNLADRVYSKEVKDKPMPEGPYPAWQDLALGRRRFLPAEPRSTGFSSETFEAIAAEAKTIVDTEKEIGKKDRKSLAGYRKERNIAWAEQVMTFKEKIDNLQRQKAKISQDTRMDPAERQRKLDMMTNQIRAFERRGILIANKREKAAEE